MYDSTADEFSPAPGTPGEGWGGGFLGLLLICLTITLAPVSRADQPATTTTRVSVSFVRDVAPILVEQCQGCHGPDKSKGGYRLDTFDRLMTPGESQDRPVTAGKPAQSQIYQLITTGEEDDRMP